LPEKLTILICGATGLLGHTLAPLLTQAGHGVIRHGRTLQAGADLACDLGDAHAVKAMLEEIRPQAVVNLAALADVDACEKDPARAMAMNTGIAQTLAGWTKGRAGLVHISSDQVYGGSGEGPYREAQAAPVNEYGRSKLAGEAHVTDAGGIALRTNFFGRSRLSGRTSYSDWLVRQFRAGKPFELPGAQVLFSPLRMETLAIAMETACRHAAAGCNGGVYNAGSRGAMSKADFASAIAARFGLDASLALQVTDQASGRARRPLDMHMDSRLFEETFDIALPSLKEEIGNVETSDAQAE
jgi:dTDP-4-dehydrorhamnose reductase